MVETVVNTLYPIRSLLHTNNCFVKELADSFELNLTSDAFSSQQSQLKHLPDIEKHDGYTCKRAYNIAGDAVQEQNSWQFWIPSYLSNDSIKRAHVHPLSAHGGIVETICRSKRVCYWAKKVK